MKYIIFLLILISHLFILSNLTFTAWPEMLFYPYLYSHGFNLYKDFIIPYPPLLVMFLSTVFNIFSYTPEILKYLTWFLILSADLLLFLNLKKLTNNILISSFFLVIYIFLQSFLDGNMLWFDFATVIPLLLAVWFLLKWIEDKKIKNLFFVSLFLTLAVLIKQVAIIYFLAFLFLYLLIRGIRKIRDLPAGRQEIGVMGGGILILIIPLMVYLLGTNSLIYFWNWTLLYPLTEWSKFPGYVDFDIPRRYTFITLSLLSPIIFALLSLHKLLKEKIFFFLLAFLVAAIIAVYPRYSFFHLQPTIVFIILLSAVIFIKLSNRLRVIHGVFVVGASFLIIYLIYKGVIGDGIRFFGAEEIRLGNQIKEMTKKEDKIFLLGIHAGGYMVSGHLPPKRWSDNFGWYLEIPGVSEWVLEGMRKDPPKKIFWRVPEKGEWYDLGSYQPQKITEFIRQNYIQTGKMEEGIEIWNQKD